jgi:hypothetical protein
MQRNIGIGLTALALFAVSASGQTLKQAAHAQVIADLKKAHQLLSEANHDYHGHRAKAAEEVHKALKELGHHHKPATTTAATGVAPKTENRVAKTGGKEDQSVSDGQLRQAQQILQSALGHLNNRHPKAHTNVAAAIGEINQAFASRQATAAKKVQQ